MTSIMNGKGWTKIVNRTGKVLTVECSIHGAEPGEISITADGPGSEVMFLPQDTVQTLVITIAEEPE
ncbi:MAG: hypothetical protein RLZZ403_468 [Pseudomonadota bacterium]|jgi:hypothetical protein